MAKWIKFEKPWHGLSVHMTVADKVDFFAGKSDSWGIEASYSPYDRSIILKIFNLYAGFEVWHKDIDS